MGENVSVGAGKNRLEIKDGRVSANGKGYGRVKEGDAVLLDGEGQLSVNGQMRPPE